MLLLMRKDFKVCPRSPVIFWLLVMPLFLTFFIQVVFGALFESEPVLGISAPVMSVLSDNLRSAEGIKVVSMQEAELLETLEGGGVDAGLFLSDSFEDSVRAGEKPLLRFYGSTTGSPANSAVLLLLIMDELRILQGVSGNLSISVTAPEGDDQLPLSERMVPSMILIVMIVSGIFTPAFMLVEEKEKGTILAVLATPVGPGEFLLSKALVGFCLAMLITLFTLFLNGVKGFDLTALLVCFAVGTAVCNCIGLIYGTLAKDSKSLYTMVKSLNIILAAPIMFYLFPAWPTWIAKLFPTYWFMDPAYRVTMYGADLSDVAGHLTVAAATAVLLGFAAVFLGKRMRNRLAGT